VLAGLRRLRNQIGVRVGRRAQNDCIDGRIVNDCIGRIYDLGDVVSCGQALGRGDIYVGDNDCLGLRRTEGQCFSMNGADAAGA